jgi:hypothetical protein
MISEVLPVTGNKGVKQVNDVVNRMKLTGMEVGRRGKKEYKKN